MQNYDAYNNFLFLISVIILARGQSVLTSEEKK